MAGTPVIYGIKTCDTVRKARKWLVDHGVEARFHDYRADGVDTERVADWVAEHGVDTVLNRASATFRALPAEAKDDLSDAAAVALMVEQPTLIKRPVLDLGDRRLVGFRPADYAAAFP